MAQKPPATDAATLLTDDPIDVMEVAARAPRNATEVRMLIGAAADLHSRIQPLQADETYVMEPEEDGTVRGKIGISHTDDRSYTAAKQFINSIPGAEVRYEAGKTVKRAGTAGVTFTVEFPEDADDAEPTEDEINEETIRRLDVPAGDEMVSILKGSAAYSYGLRDEHITVHNQFKVTVEMTGTSRRGKVTDVQSRIRQNAEDAGWRLRSVNFEAKELLFEAEGWADAKKAVKDELEAAR